MLVMYSKWCVLATSICTGKLMAKYNIILRDFHTKTVYSLIEEIKQVRFDAFTNETRMHIYCEDQHANVYLCIY